MSAASEASQSRWYLGGLAAWFASLGLSMVVFPWLVAVVLKEPAQRVGLAQMAMMGPAIAFMLLGGAVADRAECRGLLLRYHVLAALPPLAGIVGAGALSYPVLIGYGFAAGTLGALVVPARDALLTRVVRRGRERAIAVSSAAQFGCQLAGIAIAGGAGAIGAVALLMGQGAILLLGALAVFNLHPAPAGPGHRADESRLRAMRDGVAEVWASARVFPIIVVMLAAGVLYGGPFAVILPLIARDVYGGGAGELALMNMGFWGGTIAAGLVQIRLGALGRPGRAIAVSMAGGVVVLALMAAPLPLGAFAVLCLAWGVGAGVTITQGRTIVQLATPESHRARVLAIFQLGFAGGAPVGALAMGYLAAQTGPRAAAVYPAAAMAVILAFLLARSGLWRQARAAAAGGRTAGP